MSKTEVEVRFGQDECGEEEVSAHRLFLCVEERRESFRSLPM